MSTIAWKSYAGPYEVSLLNVKHCLIDMAPGASKGFRGVQPNFDSAQAELAVSFPVYGEAAGISPKVYDAFLSETADIDELSATEVILEKMLEVTRESKRLKVHNRENLIAQMVDTVKSTAHRTGDKALLAPFEKTIQYNGQIAQKAAKTRRKNAEAEATPESDGDATAG